MNYTYPEIRDVMMILAKYVQNGTLSGNSKYKNMIVLTPRSDKDVGTLTNFLAKYAVKSSVVEESMGRIVLFEIGQNEIIDVTANEMAKDEVRMKNVANRIFQAIYSVPNTRSDR